MQLPIWPLKYLYQLFLGSGMKSIDDSNGTANLSGSTTRKTFNI